MRESAQLSLTFAKIFLASLSKDDFFNSHKLHMHIPEGATRKDGPSAGVTMVTSLLSLALEKKGTRRSRLG